jgi:hypothetical protein
MSVTTSPRYVCCRWANACGRKRDGPTRNIPEQKNITYIYIYKNTHEAQTCDAQTLLFCGGGAIPFHFHGLRRHGGSILQLRCVYVCGSVAGFARDATELLSSTEDNIYT